ncbi:hypothetical protein AB0E96_25975, partial [Kitasatospora sp. NPDC036755]|uniref:hypothetical protein n=1 Tax=Kitasatospora sp. NPDC036755 TaxID=3154600 RepID=UPI0033E24A9D
MRSARTLLAGAAVAAALTVGTPMAFADGAADQGKNLTWQEKTEKASDNSGSSKANDDRKGGAASEERKGTDEHKGTEDHKGSDEHKGTDEHKGGEAKDEDHKTPHGGVHTGGGGLALSGGGLASGAVLLLGGLGNCRFVTTDLARRADGSGWRVVE